MEFIICYFVLGIFGIGYFITKIVDWLENRKPKFSSSKSEFVSDLYKLQNKWMKKGEFDYAQSIQLIITSWNLPDSQKEAETLEGREMQEKMRKAALNSQSLNDA